MDFSDIRKVLVVRLSALGDIVHTIPAVQGLSRVFPNIHIDWLTSPPYREFLDKTDGIDRVWTLDLKNPKSRISEVISTVRRLRKEKYDLTIDFQGLIKSAIPARLSGAKKIIGPDSSQAREPMTRWFYTEQIKASENPLHQVEYHFEIAFGGASRNEITPKISLHLPDSTFVYIQRELSKRKLRRPVLLNPGAGWTTKTWSPKRWAELSRKMRTELKLPTLFTYGPGEKGLINKILKFEPDYVLAFPTSILEFAALCKKSRLIVAGDTGPMHLAVAMGLPAVAILGPALAWRTGPYGKSNISVLHSPPCPTPYRRKCEDHFCMDIPVDEVFDAVKKRLGMFRR
jgi:lipopolysaccharide heptosyltransferase I